MTFLASATSFLLSIGIVNTVLVFVIIFDISALDLAGDAYYVSYALVVGFTLADRESSKVFS